MVALFHDDREIKPNHFLLNLKQKLLDLNVKWNREEEDDKEDVSNEGEFSVMQTKQLQNNLQSMRTAHKKINVLPKTPQLKHVLTD